MTDGMLRIWLEAVVPEHKKPKKIPIGDGSGVKSTKSEFLSE